MFCHALSRGLLLKCAQTSVTCPSRTCVSWTCTVTSPSSTTRPPTSTWGSEKYRRRCQQSEIRKYSTRDRTYVQDPHDVLGLHPQATKREIKSAYIRLSKLHHPDKNPDNPNAAAEFNSIRDAYERLMADIETGREDQEFDDLDHHHHQHHHHHHGQGDHEDMRRGRHREFDRRRSKARSFDDWIKEVERNARERKKEERRSDNKQSADQHKQQESFWGPEFEKDFNRFESRFTADLDRAIRITRVRHKLEEEFTDSLATRVGNKIAILYLYTIKCLVKFGARAVIILFIVLMVLETSSEN